MALCSRITTIKPFRSSSSLSCTRVSAFSALRSGVRLNASKGFGQAETKTEEVKPGQATST